MTLIALAVLAAAAMAAPPPCVYWTQGVDSRPAIEAAGITRLCVPPEQLEVWRGAGFPVTALTAADLAARTALPVPGVTARPGLASPTRSPWVIASGWHITRQPAATFVYDLPAGKAMLAAAEAFAYGADAVLKIDAADVKSVGGMLTFLAGLPAADLPPIADLAVVDDGSAVTGEVMNLLARRNILFQVVTAPATRFRINIAMGTPAYPLADAADPSAFALKIRRQLTDDERSLRVYGSEVVVCRLTGDAAQVRLHLLNYGGRDIEGLRVRLRGVYSQDAAHVAGAGRLPLADFAVTDGFTEFSLPRIATYAIIDLKTAK